MLKNLLLLFFTFCGIIAIGQNQRTDSLRLIIEENKSLSRTQSLTIINNLFEEFHFQGNEEKSLYYADLLIETAKKLEESSFVRQGKVNYAWTFFYKDKNKGRAYVMEVLEEAQDAGDQLIEGQCYLYLGLFNQIHLNRNTDCSYFEKAQKAFEGLETIKKVEVLLGLARCRDTKSGYEKSLSIVQQALQMAKAANQPVLINKAQAFLIFYQFQLVQYEEATTSVHEAIELALKYNYFTNELNYFYTILTDLYYLAGKYEETIEYAELSYQTSKRINRNKAKARAASVLGFYYMKIKPDKYDEAEELLKYSINLAEQHFLSQRHISALYFYGNLQEKKGNKEEAIKQYLKCLEIADTSAYSNENFEIRVQSTIANLLNDFPVNFDLFLLEKSISNKNLDSLNLHPRRMVYEIRKMQAIRNNNYQDAFTWLEKEMAIRNEIKTNEFNASLNKILIKQKLEEQEKDNLRMLESLKNTKLINGLLIVLTILFLLLIGIQYFRIKAKRKYHDDILQKNKEISEAMNQISLLNNSLAEKNELLQEKNKLKDKELYDYATYKAVHDQELKKIKSNFEELAKKQKVSTVDLKLIESKIAQLQNKEEENWVSFKEKIEDNFPNFFSKLTMKHPELTEKDKYHCGYIIIGMSVKSVAELTFVSPTTVNSSRYRIKKKIGLTKDDSLKEYLLNC